jgi:ELWxxDGT repeat protein
LPFEYLPSGLAIFFNSDAEHGLEPWVTDGTATGTHLLADTNPGPASMIVGDDLGRTAFYAFKVNRAGDRLFFASFDRQNGSQIWATDGTPQGTESLGGYEGADLAILGPVAPNTGAEAMLLAGGGFTIGSELLIASLAANQPPVIDPISDQFALETMLFRFQVVASDPDPGQTLTFSLAPDSPFGLEIDPNTGVITWSPTEAQGPGLFWVTVIATDNGSPASSTERTFLITVGELNRAPTLSPIDDQVIDEGASLVIRAIATDPDLPVQTLTYRLADGSPVGMSINPNSGLITWIPTEWQAPGEYTITVIVSDDDATPLTDSKTFRVTVNEVNQAPTLSAIGAQSANEGSLFFLQVVAADADWPAQSLTFNLSTAPAGMTVNPGTGAIAWTPTEAQGPGDYVVTIVVTDNGSPPKSAQQSFAIHVAEVNEAPTLNPIANQQLPFGSTLQLSFAATDPDLPANTLTFSLAPGAPAGASVHPTTGLFTFATAVPGTYSITAVVTDSGAPPRSDQRTFSVIVLPPPAPQPIGVPKLITNKAGNVTALVLSFDGDLDAASAQSLANYSLAPYKFVKAKVKYAAPIALKSAAYDASKRTVTITLLKPLKLNRDFEFNATNLRDAHGRMVDGDRNGIEGGDYTAWLSTTGFVLTRRLN